jgi:hypothetical protein
LKVKFVILTDTEALLCQNMVHASSMSVGNFSLPETIMRYFPQLQASFRRVFLQDLNISLSMCIIAQ